MGWLQIGRRTETHLPFRVVETTKAQAEHVENIDLKPSHAVQLSQSKIKKYPFRPTETPDSDFPFIPADEITKRRQPNALDSSTTNSVARHEYWIVVDKIVYDCTEFISEHPGGQQVILSFVGEDCSWQFHRFHGTSEMEQYGKALRIGRTEGVKNRFSEPPRFVGLSRLGHDEW